MFSFEGMIKIFSAKANVIRPTVGIHLDLRRWRNRCGHTCFASKTKYRPTLSVVYVAHLQANVRSGDDSKEDPPVPMPNTEVKLLNVDDTWRATAWESRKLPEQKMY